MRDPTAKRMSSWHRALYRITGGVIGRRLVANDMLLLTTRGRATGNEHTVPLLYLRDGECLVVVASYGGRDRHPEWYLNLVTEPSVTAQIGRKRKSFRARTAGDDERERWWPRVVAAYSDYAVYQGRTERQIPLIMLEPPGLT